MIILQRLTSTIDVILGHMMSIVDDNVSKIVM
jgi:hypothetical protein